MHVTEVEVDTRLGTVRPLRVWAASPSGHIYEERLARSQCEGGVVQGIGYALYEERHIDPVTGIVLTENLEDYRIPGIGDTPEIAVHFHQDGFEHVTGGGVGLGEISTIARGRLGRQRRPQRDRLAPARPAHPPRPAARRNRPVTALSSPASPALGPTSVEKPRAPSRGRR